MKYTAKVVSGKGRGKSLGFPTFNLRLPQTFNLRHGIYASWVWVKDKKYPGALHYGPVPVFNQKTPTLEVFVINYRASIPITTIDFEPVEYLRPIKNFSSPQALKSQISQDVATVRSLLAS